MPKRVDDNQKAIVSAYRGMGVSVAITSAQGKGFPDLVVGYRGVTDLVEVKDGSKPPSARRLTPHEQRFHETWKGSPVRVIESQADVLEHVQSILGRANTRLFHE